MSSTSLLANLQSHNRQVVSAARLSRSSVLFRERAHRQHLHKHNEFCSVDDAFFLPREVEREAHERDVVVGQQPRARRHRVQHRDGLLVLAACKRRLKHLPKQESNDSSRHSGRSGFGCLFNKCPVLSPMASDAQA